MIVNQFSASSLTISSGIVNDGPVGLTKTGPGTLIVSGGAANTYTGTTTVSGGLLQSGAAHDAFRPAEASFSPAAARSI